MPNFEEDKTLKPIEHDASFRDVFADVVGLTEYNVNGTHYVNFSFIGNKVTSLVDSEGTPASARVELKKVGSVTMTLERAQALHDALTTALKAIEAGYSGE